MATTYPGRVRILARFGYVCWDSWSDQSKMVNLLEGD